MDRDGVKHAVEDPQILDTRPTRTSQEGRVRFAMHAFEFEMKTPDERG
jgi:hypothetical protein